MQTVTSSYKEAMASMIRRPSHMRITFHFDSGDITYDTTEESGTTLVKFTEKKSAHLIASELPTLEATIQLININNMFNPNNASGYHDKLVKGVRVTYDWGVNVPIIRPYGYEGDVGETYDPVYGYEDTGIPQFIYKDEVTGEYETIPAEAYGYMSGYQTEWITGGEVFTDGDLSYDNTTVTINAYDYLSLIDSPVYLDHGTKTLAEIAQLVINETNYPEDESGKKIRLGSELEAISTNMAIAPTSDDAKNPKEWLQTIAHAGGVKMYIDRLGYICMDNDPLFLSSDQYYHLYMSQQKEDPSHMKKQIPKEMVVKLNAEDSDPVKTDIGGGGEAIVVDNPYIVTTAEAETLSTYISDYFIPFRNTGEIEYRGEPALDILDPLYLYTDFQESAIEAIVTNSELTYDGTLSGSLTLRYQLGENLPDIVQIEGGGEFTYAIE